MALNLGVGFRTDTSASGKIRTDWEERNDQWANAFTGLGTARDKAEQASFFWNGPLPDPELTALYWNNDLAAKIIEKLPRAAFRAGMTLTGDSDGKVATWSNQKFIETAFLEGAYLARAFGGSLLWAGLADGLNPWEPADWDTVEDFNFLIPMDRRYVHVNRYYTDPNDPKFGQPMMYMIGDPTTAMVALIHESRTIRFDGVKVDRRLRQILRGWGLSVLQRPYETLSSFGQSFQALTNLLIDANQGVYKMKDLYAQLSEDPVALQQRMGKLDMMRSAGRGLLIDAEEEFERTPTTFGGIAPSLSVQMLRMAAAADMPVTLLFGREPAGLNATGESDMDQWYDNVRETQNTYTDPMLKLLKVGARAKGVDPDALGILWSNPDQPGKAEEAAAELAVAQRDQIYLQNGVWLPEEVAIARSQGKDKAEETTIDINARKASLKQTVAGLGDGNLNNPPNEQGNEEIGTKKSPLPEAVGNLAGNSVQGKQIESGPKATEEAGASQQTRPPGAFSLSPGPTSRKKPKDDPGSGGSY